MDSIFFVYLHAIPFLLSTWLQHLPSGAASSGVGLHPHAQWSGPPRPTTQRTPCIRQLRDLGSRRCATIDSTRQLRDPPPWPERGLRRAIWSTCSPSSSPAEATQTISADDFSWVLRFGVQSLIRLEINVVYVSLHLFSLSFWWEILCLCLSICPCIRDLSNFPPSRCSTLLSCSVCYRYHGHNQTNLEFTSYRLRYPCFLIPFS
jgi:hypothetical protein